MINNVNGSTSVVQHYQPKRNQNLENTSIAAEKAVVLESNRTPAKNNAVYGRPKANNINYNEINRLIEETEKSYNGLRELIRKLLSEQGKKHKDLSVDKEVPVEESILGADEWGVEAVSDRLVAFAKAVSGNDKTKIPELKDAITQGFREAEKLFGGLLPEICYKTYNETMRKLDEWANSND